MYSRLNIEEDIMCWLNYDNETENDCGNCCNDSYCRGLSEETQEED